MSNQNGFEFEDAENLFGQMKDELDDEAIKLKAIDLIEDKLRSQSRELSRRLLQGYLAKCGNGEVRETVISSSKIQLTHRRLLKKSFYTMFGKVELSRFGYSTREHPVVYPLDAVLNLPSSSFSYPLQKFLVKEAAKGSIGEALTLVYEVSGVVISKGKALDLVQGSAIDFDNFYESTKAPKEEDISEVPLMILTTDGKGVVMRPEGLREGTKKRREQLKNKHKTRLSKGEKRNAKRMAQVASIYYIQRFVRRPKDVYDECFRNKSKKKRPKPIFKRIWASVEKDASVVIESLVSEAKSRDPKQKKEWVVLVDGQDYQIEEIKRSLKQFNVEAVIVLDIVHVIEYLWKAAHQFFEEGSWECEKWVESKLQQVLEQGGKKTAGSIRMSAAKCLSKERNKIVEKTTTYLSERSAYTDYAFYLKKGYPIGTGVIEGACRYLVKDRMDITGARWGLTGAEAILKLRSILKSEDMDLYWKYHIKQEYRRNHLSKFHKVPKTQGFAS
jgi:hypothetical protein